MATKSILIVGDASTFLLHDIVYHLSSGDEDLRIDLLNTNPQLLVHDKSIYDNIICLNGFLSSVQKVINKVNPYAGFFAMRFVIRHQLNRIKQHYNYTHIHFFNKNFFYINVDKFLKNTEKLYISFWGSDFYKRNNAQRQKMIPYLNAASIIIFANPQMRNDFHNHFNNYFTKTKILAIGLDIFNVISDLQGKYPHPKIQYRNEFEIPTDKIVVSIGYGSHPEQHQVEIIQNICSKVDRTILEDIFFIFPLTYGDKKYKNQIIDTAKKLNLEYKAFTSEMTKADIAKMRIASDIMVHLRDTDQFSGSFQEYLYAQNIVITGSWLPYQFILDKGIYLNIIDNRDKLPEILSKIIVNLTSEFEKTKNNSKIIAEISSWDNIIKNHLALYN